MTDYERFIEYTGEYLATIHDDEAWNNAADALMCVCLKMYGCDYKRMALDMQRSYDMQRVYDKHNDEQ